MRLKRLLAEGENALHAVRATEADWLRDGFGPGAGFTAFVAEDANGVVGMTTCSQGVITGWNGHVLFLQDLFASPMPASMASPAHSWPAWRRSPATSAARSSNSRCIPRIRRGTFISATASSRCRNA